MKNILKQNDFLKPPKVGDIIEGQVIGIGRSCVYLDLNAWKTGIIYGKEFYEVKDKLKNLNIGDKILAKIIELENEDGYTELSLKQADEEAIWRALIQKREEQKSLTVKILGANKGGLLTNISGIPAFLPVSQLSPEHYPQVENADKSKILRKLQQLIGKELEVKIFDLNPKEKKIILSEKANRVEKIKEVLKNYKVNDIIEGEVTGITDFGAFVKFSSTPPKTSSNKEEKLSTLPKEQKDEPDKPKEIEGLIHISELDWQLIENPSEIVKVGQKIKAQIIKIDDSRVYLSLKTLKKDPWKDIEKKYKKGDVVTGKVVKFNNFGAFVQLPLDKTDPAESSNSAGKIQGLIHISEFGTKAKMEETLKIGKSYNFKILSIDPTEHKIGLKLVDKLDH